MKPTIQEFNAAVQAMAELIPFFPQSEAAQKFIVDSLREVVESKQALSRLTSSAINNMERWSSIATLRIMHAEICEQMYRDREQAEQKRKLLAREGESRKLLPPTPEEQARIDEEKLLLAKTWHECAIHTAVWTSSPGKLGRMDRELAEQSATAPRLTDEQKADRLAALQMALGRDA